MKQLLLFLVTVCISLNLVAANTITENSSTITTTVNVRAKTDYVLTAKTNLFSETGSINISRTAQKSSVIIFKYIRPSNVIKNWLKYVTIVGEAAVDGQNCQVKMYGTGTIIMPYDANESPLTCYSQTNYKGTSYSGYTTGSVGGYMKTLTEEELLNNIRSFKLKRGYMVTFATGTAGYGYSRCFIADKEDLEMNLPIVLAGKVSSYRLFVWYNAPKKGLACDMTPSTNDALNSCWTYSWGVGDNMLPDVECVPHKIHKNWPGVADCGRVEWACHMKTDNEPANPADDTPGTVDEILGYWEDAMRTGLRLLSPSSHDSGYAWQEQFMNAIDERGWRCDVLDMHCYWASGSFSSLGGYFNKYHRPIWISEMLWGASWNSNGIFSAVSDWDSNSDANQTANYNGGRPILDQLNGYDYVERYAWWNGERNCSKVHCDGKLTKLGQYYADMDCGLAYNSANEYIPLVVIGKPYAINLVSTDADNFTLTWKDPNGDMVDEILVQYRTEGSTTWNTLETLAPKDKTSRDDQSYAYSGTLENFADYYFRIADKYGTVSYASIEVHPTFIDDITDITSMPGNLNDFYFQIYSKEAGTELVWGLGNGTNTTDIYYQTPAEETGSDLGQLWMFESDSYGGYTMRNLKASDYVMCSPDSWNFITNNSAYTKTAPKASYLPLYYADGNYFVFKNVGHNTYVGLWDSDKRFSAGERLAGNRTNPNSGNDSGDRVGIRAIPRNIINGLNGLDEDIQGAYYFYNPARDLFLTAGNKWGTQASVGTTGLDLTIQSVGQYFLIDSRVSNGSTNHYFGLDGNKALYLDSPPAYWTIAPGKLTIDGRSTYTFATSDIGYMAAPTTGTVLTTVSDPDDEYAQWMLVTREDLVAKMNDASENNPVDADFLLPGYNFSRNDQRNGTWNGNPTVGGDAVNCCGEKFNTTFDVWQQLENIPNGEYRLTMQGFYRCGGYRDAASLRTSGREELNAILYFGDQTCPLPSIFDEAGQCGTTGVETTHGYIPNTMTESSAYLNEGCYAVGPLTTFVTDGTLRLGISKTVSVEADWALFDNFHLMYYGGYATEIHSPEAPTDENRRKGVYDLQGRRIADDSSFFIHHSSFPKGLYIVDGKKVLLK